MANLAICSTSGFKYINPRSDVGINDNVETLYIWS